MCSRILLICFLTSALWTSVHGSCEILDRHDGCQYTIHCLATAGSMYTSGCDDEPNVTFIMEASNVWAINLGFFSRTNFDQRVRHFIAVNNAWDTIEPSTFKYYRKSVEMNLFRNRIIDIKDGAFNELVMLKSLNLSDNMINKLTDKSLQLSVISQNSLEVLDLSMNRISFVSDYVFSNLVNLKTLLLNQNIITTMGSSCFSSLRQLNHLNLFGNLISSLNLTVAAMGELKYLDLSCNKINKLTGLEMLRLMSLTHLNVSHNAIESVSDNCFAQVFSLKTLDLSYNRIATPIENEMFKYNSNLTYLNLYQNNITLLGDSVFKSTKLTYLNFEKNNLTGDVTSDSLSGLYNVTHLDITNQHIAAIKDNAFSDMISLKYLNLSHNNIKVVENASFVDASELTVLDLSNNFITDINFFGLFNSNLITVNINSNNITYIREYLFSNHSSLEKLNLSANAITTIEPNSLPLNSIQTLLLEENNISGTIVAGVFSPAWKLRELEIRMQNITAINESAFIDMPSLERLDLSFNHIRCIDPNNFKNLTNLIDLDLSHNDFTTLDIEGKLGKLTHISIGKNMLKSIPNLLKFVNASTLMYLDISHSNISNVSYPGFENMSNLVQLNLENNNISYFNNQYVNKLTNLVCLYLKNNHIKDINLSSFERLNYIDLSSNDIAFLNESQFQNLYSLMTLNLSSNVIQDISPGTFQHLSSLKILTLSENNISNLRFGTFRGLNRTEIIDLSHNKIRTINVDIFHECYALSKLIIDYNNITNVDLERLVEVSLYLEVISLGGNPIACEEIVRSKSNRKLSAKNIEVTAMHKIFHEDNVHGIRCGDTNTNATVEVTTEMVKTTVASKSVSDHGNSLMLFGTLCTLIGIICVLLAGAGFMYWRRRNATVSGDTRMQFSTASSRNSECYSDLLN